MKALYLDVPFERESGGDKNRSRFLWGALQAGFGAEWVAILAPGNVTEGRERPRYGQWLPVAELRAGRPAAWRPAAVHAFGATERESFGRVLAGGGHGFVCARFYSPGELLQEAAKRRPGLPVVVDVDMLSSRLVGFAWAARRSVRNRWFLFEKLKLEWYERWLFGQPWLFLFSNPTEMEWVRTRVLRWGGRGRLACLPNFMPPKAEATPAEGSAVLFFGSLDSAANVDGVSFLLDEVLPRAEPVLRRHGVQIRVAGKNPPPALREKVSRLETDRVVLLGAVDSMERTLAESRFVLLPLRIASGTRTRILEAAAVGKAVVTTALGAEGLGLGPEEVCLAEDGAGLAEWVRRLLEEPGLAAGLGRRLQDKCWDLYRPERVAADLVREIREFAAR